MVVTGNGYRGEGKLQQAFYYWAGDEAWGLDLKERKERQGPAVTCFPGQSEPYFSKVGRHYKNCATNR